MKRGLGWVEVSLGRSVLTFNGLAITSPSIWLRLGEPIPLGMNDTLTTRALCAFAPGTDGGRVMILNEFSFDGHRVEIGFSSWLHLGNG